jgi:hypothetical protein
MTMNEFANLRAILAPLAARVDGTMSKPELKEAHAGSFTWLEVLDTIIHAYDRGWVALGKGGYVILTHAGREVVAV